MKRHPREQLVSKVRVDLEGAMLEVLEKHEGLTVNETIQAISHVSNSLIGHITKMEIRMERHGDYEKSGGLVYEEDNG